MITKEFLTNIPIFKFLPEEDYLSLVSLWKKRDLKKGDILFKKGDPGNSMYVIEHGVVEIVLPVDPPVNEMLISTLNEGEFFGELSLFADTPRTATARALEDCILIEMSHKDFNAFLLERPYIGVSMLSEMAKRLQSTNEIITSLASKNTNEEFEENLSFGDRVADKIAVFGGSWGFILSFGAFMAVWISINVLQFTFQPFDPYPFTFLNLMLSTVAALQAPVIMMSQNRAQSKDRLKADLDYQINLKSELMLQQMHQKMDQLQENQLPSLVSEMKEQIVELRSRVGTLENPKKKSSAKPSKKRSPK